MAFSAEYGSLQPELVAVKNTTKHKEIDPYRIQSNLSIRMRDLPGEYFIVVIQDIRLSQTLVA
jgi:hypothetical protein